MSKNKRSHYRSEEQKNEESDDQQSGRSNPSEYSGQLVEQKKRHRKKSSKKAKKHRSKRKRSQSESDSGSDDSSESSGSSSSEEEVVKRKKQKKHKKNKRRNREMHAEQSDNDVKVLHEPPKVHYVSSGDEERHRKSLKRAEERKRHLDPVTEERSVKSKWDSPTAEIERKRLREAHQERRVDDRGHREAIRPDVYRERCRQSPPRQRQPPHLQQPDRERFDRRNVEPDFRNREPNPDWRPRDRRQGEPPEHYRRNEQQNQERNPERRNRFEDNRNFGRQEFERKRSNSPRREPNRNRGFEKEREIPNRRPNNFTDRRERERSRSNEKQRNEFGRKDRSNERQIRTDNRGERPHERMLRNDGNRGERSIERPIEMQRPQRNENRREFNDRRRSGSPRKRTRFDQEIRNPDVNRLNERQPARPNPFRRNRDERSDFRPEEDRPYRNDRNDNRIDRERKRPLNKDSDNENYEWGKSNDNDKKDVKDEKDEKLEEKEKPNFGLSGKLTEDTNKVNGVVIKYAEPPEARRPKRKWRLYPFKGDQSLQTLHIHRQSCYLIGRDKKICEIPVDHPSCSKQHAALQYRLVPYEKGDGTTGKRVRLYVIDLESANGTFLNNNKIEPKKYYEMVERDVLKFGFSTREYVLLHEDSSKDEEDDLAYEESIKSEK